MQTNQTPNPLKEIRRGILYHASSIIKSIDTYGMMLPAEERTSSPILYSRPEAYAIAINAAIECCLPMEETELDKLHENDYEKILAKSSDEAQKLLESMGITDNAPDSGTQPAGSPARAKAIRQSILRDSISLYEKMNNYKETLRDAKVPFSTGITETIRTDAYPLVYNAAIEALTDMHVKETVDEDDILEMLDMYEITKPS